MKKYCWLTNPSGRPEHWIEIDRSQEHNVEDVKHTFAAIGPNASWEYVKEESGAIPTMRRVKDHTESEINPGRRGKAHTRPAKEDDIKRLQASYEHARAHIRDARAPIIACKDRFRDFIGTGLSTKLTATVMRWSKKRNTHYAMMQEWESETEET